MMTILKSGAAIMLLVVSCNMAWADLKQTEEKTVQAVDHGVKKAGAFVAKGLEKGADGVAYGARKTKEGVEKAANWAGVGEGGKAQGK